jgi:acetyltransferase-like isoleucine patch superfamily enzyme
MVVKIAWRFVKANLHRWWTQIDVQCRFPNAQFAFPIHWQVDDFRGVQIGDFGYIAGFSEVVVDTVSEYSKIAGQLQIGDRVVIGAFANIRACGGKVIIGDNALIAQRVSLIASNHSTAGDQPYRDLLWDEDKTDVIIGENVWLGAGVVVLPGCVIGRNSVVGAGSVVTRSVPANQVWAGVPARKLRDLGSHYENSSS